MADQMQSWTDGQAKTQILSSPPPTPTRTSATTNHSWTPSPQDGSPPNPTCKIPAAAALTGELSGHVFLNLTLM